jgi:hypothetical protein
LSRQAALLRRVIPDSRGAPRPFETGHVEIATMLAIGSWIQTGLTHDWVSGDFIVSQLIEAVGLAFAVTSVIAFAAANVTPALAAAIATTIQIARWLGTELGSVVMQTFVLPEATSGRGYVRNGDAS